MKKIYFSVFTIFTALSLNAQQTIGFEGVILAPESFNNGSDFSGGFFENGVVFPNTYNPDWGGYMESGFAVSNMTDVTTAGFTNQYSSFAGSGAASSANYGVCYGNGSILFAGQGVDLLSIDVTNTTYAALSMRDGDAYGKVFGSANDANGNPDGTNGEDFYKMWIFAHAEDGSKIDSTDFYLADYRFSDNNQDYIVDEWTTVDLSFVGETVYALSFQLESSDMGDWGMNTPSYFAVDSLVIITSIGITETTLTDVSVYPNPMVNELIVKGENGLIELYDVTGKVILSENHSSYSVFDIAHLASGSYTLKITNERGSFVQKLVK